MELGNICLIFLLQQNTPRRVNAIQKTNKNKEHLKHSTTRTLTQPDEEVHGEADRRNKQEHFEPELHGAAAPHQFHFQVVHGGSQVVASPVHVVVL